MLRLLVDEFERHLQADPFQVGGRLGRRHVEVEVKETVKGVLSRLLQLQLGEQADEPLKVIGLAINPDKINL